MQRRPKIENVILQRTSLANNKILRVAEIVDKSSNENYMSLKSSNQAIYIILAITPLFKIRIKSISRTKRIRISIHGPLQRKRNRLPVVSFSLTIENQPNQYAIQVVLQRDVLVLAFLLVDPLFLSYDAKIISLFYDISLI